MCGHLDHWCVLLESINSSDKAQRQRHTRSPIHPEVSTARKRRRHRSLSKTTHAITPSDLNTVDTTPLLPTLFRPLILEFKFQTSIFSGGPVAGPFRAASNSSECLRGPAFHPTECLPEWLRGSFQVRLEQSARVRIT